MPLQLVDDHGWDNTVYRLGNDHAVRLPRRAAAAALLANELRWLPVLAPRLPLPVPEPVVAGRPAPGYPACPDHTEKSTLFTLLDAQASIQVELTEHYAMFPAASVSGFYIAHPDARYFGLGKIDRDQTQAYAERKGISLSEAERWLRPVLKYA